MWKAYLFIIVMLAGGGTAYGQYEEIVGTWEWISTDSSDGVVSSPTTVGHREQYYFGPDHAFILYVDEQIALESFWGVSDMFIGPCSIALLGWQEGGWLWSVEQAEYRWLHLSDDIWCPVGGSEHPDVITTMTLVNRDAVPAEGTSWGAVKSLFR